MTGGGQRGRAVGDTAPAMTTRIGENFTHTPVKNRLTGPGNGGGRWHRRRWAIASQTPSPADISLISALLVAQRDRCVLATELAKAPRPLDCLERGALACEPSSTRSLRS